MAKQQITAPAVEPVTLDDAITHLRAGDNDDDYITSLIVAAREMAESYTERALISQQWSMVLDRFPSGGIKLPLAPLLSVDSVAYYDTDNAQQTLASGDYYVDSVSVPARLSVVNSWPDTYDRINAVAVTFTAGYGTGQESVPMPIRQAILLLIAEMFENREESIVGVSVSKLPLTAERLLNPYRIISA